MDQKKEAQHSTSTVRMSRQNRALTCCLMKGKKSKSPSVNPNHPPLPGDCPRASGRLEGWRKGLKVQSLWKACFSSCRRCWRWWSWARRSRLALLWSRGMYLILASKVTFSDLTVREYSPSSRSGLSGKVHLRISMPLSQKMTSKDCSSISRVYSWLRRGLRALTRVTSGRSVGRILYWKVGSFVNRVQMEACTILKNTNVFPLLRTPPLSLSTAPAWYSSRRMQIFDVYRFSMYLSTRSSREAPPCPAAWLQSSWSTSRSHLSRICWSKRQRNWSQLWSWRGGVWGKRARMRALSSWWLRVLSRNEDSYQRSMIIILYTDLHQLHPLQYIHMHYKPHRAPTALTLALLALHLATCLAITTDNTCTFKADGKLFTFALLNQIAKGDFYTHAHDPTHSVVFNFCDPFLPKECAGNKQKAYSFVVKRVGEGEAECFPFSSDSKLTHFTPTYINERGEIKVNLSLTTYQSNATATRTTDFVLDCQEGEGLLTNIRTVLEGERLVVYGRSPSACPVFQLGSIWKALGENKGVLGVVLVGVGFVMLFFGILMTHLMVFIAAYLVSLALLAALGSLFLRPDSNTLEIYFALLLVLFLCTLFAYSMTRLLRVSLFFIGAFLGLILAAIANSVLAKLFDLYSVWSLVVLEVLLVIPLGLLTFRHSDQIIVLSTSLCGSYLMVRPFSWLLGGFPNEFTLYLMIENGEIETLPWTFFIYILIIAAIALVGALYQFLKIRRSQGNHHIEAGFITQKVEVHIDRIKLAVENIISKYAPEGEEDHYREMQEYQGEGKKKEEERKSREEHF